MRNLSTVKKLYFLLFFFAVLSFAGCNNLTGDSVTLTITTQEWDWHMEQPATVTTQKVSCGDRVWLEAWNSEEAEGVVIRIKEMQDDFVVIEYESFPEPGLLVNSQIVSVEYGVEYEISTATLSSWFVWTLVFEI